MIKQFLLILILLCGNVYSKDIYISPTGNDGGTGTINNPFRNLITAINRSAAGDTIFCRGGTYVIGRTELFRKNGKGGKNGSYLTIKAFPGETPTFRGVSDRFLIWADYVRLEGLSIITPWRFDIFGRGNQVINCKFTGSQPKYGAILAGGNGCLFEGNTITVTPGGNTRDHGIYLKSGTGNIIRNNTIIGTQGYGIHIFEDGTNGNLIKDLLITGNYISRSVQRSGIILATENAAKIDGVVIEGNTLERNRDFGVYIRQGNSISVKNNYFVSNIAKPQLKVNNGVTNYTESGNTFTGSGGEPPPSPSNFRITTENLPSGIKDALYSFKLEAEGGELPYQWRATGVPLGTVLTENGFLNGTPQVAGMFTIEAKVRASGSEHIAAKIFNLEIIGEGEPPLPPPDPVPAYGDTIVIDLSKVEKIIFVLKKEQDQ